MQPATNKAVLLIGLTTISSLRFGAVAVFCCGLCSFMHVATQLRLEMQFDPNAHEDHMELTTHFFFSNNNAVLLHPRSIPRRRCRCARHLNRLQHPPAPLDQVNRRLHRRHLKDKQLRQ
ncbi:hypothetical protein CORC01_13072 [Colletotrichum orchidophilum]|uniref:Uncharacterized protein n=1 Tax=Colletotrichum orchidophilum TaxID=1209926 RepID=A0A1G4ARA3_9PEZI|nr:uncharacterized protein CORC01_13072 [Colletotrichum orchidophilum]OHE91636.1 hypothetical protein CORC01_13072 [Colletotrichum orchidophilum]